MHQLHVLTFGLAPQLLKKKRHTLLIAQMGYYTFFTLWMYNEGDVSEWLSCPPQALWAFGNLALCTSAPLWECLQVPVHFPVSGPRFEPVTHRHPVLSITDCTTVCLPWHGKKAVFTFTLLSLILELPSTSNYRPMQEDLILKEV